MKEIGFNYEKRSKQELLIERNDIILWRHSYLRKIKRFREEGTDIIYLDETWVNVGQTILKEWHDKYITTPKGAFLVGFTTGLKHPTACGPRFVIVHAGRKNGFINDAKLVFLAKKNSADYLDEVDSERFEKWFQDQLLPNIRPGSVIIMDNAAYHSRKSELLPTAAWRKENIKQWLLARNIPFTDDSLKRELLQTVESVRSEYISCVVDEIAEQRGVTVCRLPPYNCKLNPVELVWSQRDTLLYITQSSRYLS
jgi:transposase